MKIVTDRNVIKGICEIYPGDKADIKLIKALYKSLIKSDCTSVELDEDYKYLIIYRTD